MAKINGTLTVTDKTTTASLDVGGTTNLFGPVILGNTLTVNAPTSALHAATKQYVDDIAATKLNISGGTLTGPLLLAADPTVALQAATKQYVDNLTNASGVTVTTAPGSGGSANEPTYMTLIDPSSTPTAVVLKNLSRGPGISLYSGAGSGQIYIANRPYIGIDASDFPAFVRTDYSLNTQKGRMFYLKAPTGISGTRNVRLLIDRIEFPSATDLGADFELDVNEGIVFSIIVDNTTAFVSSISGILFNSVTNIPISYQASPYAGLIHIELMMIRRASGHSIVVKSIEEFDTGSSGVFGPNYIYRNSKNVNKPISSYITSGATPADINIGYEMITSTNLISSPSGPVNIVVPTTSTLNIPIDSEIIIHNIGTFPFTLVPASGVTFLNNSTSLVFPQSRRVVLRRYSGENWIITNHDGYADSKLALSGGTLTGTLTLNADPVSALQAATKQYVDNAPYTSFYELRATFVNGGIAVVADDANVVYITIPETGNLQFYSLFGNGGPSGCSIDVWKVPFASFPPSVANSITGGNYPTISGTSSASDGVLSGWTKPVNAGDVIGIKLRTNGLFTSIFFTLRVSV